MFAKKVSDKERKQMAKQEKKQAALEKKFLEDNSEAEILDAKLFSRNSLYVGENLSEELANYLSSGNKIYQFDNIPDKHGKTRNISVLQGLK